jgi:hypothetical protein
VTGLDTNILVRFLTRDDEDQFSRRLRGQGYSFAISTRRSWSRRSEASCRDLASRRRMAVLTVDRGMPPASRPASRKVKPHNRRAPHRKSAQPQLP